MAELARPIPAYNDALAILLGKPDEEIRVSSPLRSLEGLSYCPQRPLPKQQAFIDLECREALFGGAAGPGKSSALLMAALKFVHIPGYSALILRRDFPRLSLPNSIMDRARQWLAPWSRTVKWNAQDKLFRFPSGATLQFGYIDSPEDRYRYASSEYQCICFDELTEFRLDAGEANPYLFMFSRLRKSSNSAIPIRMRAATNPGNLGHTWVKRRFITDDALEALRDGHPPAVFFSDPEERTRAFVPALLSDNPHIDRKAYLQSLAHLPPVTRARLEAGDWSVIEDAIIRLEYLRYFTTRGQILIPKNATGDVLKDCVIDQRECRRFATIDTAGTSKQKAEERKGKAASWSVCAVWDYDQRFDFLYLRHIWRERADWQDLKAGIRTTLEEWQPAAVYIENAHHGPPLASEMKAEFSAVELVNPVTDDMRGQSGLPGKVERATPLLTMLAAGKVFLPTGNNSWLPDLESEWLSWTGLEDETADQIDVAAYAANKAKHGSIGGIMQMESVIARRY